MRTVAYKVLPGMGRGKSKREGTLQDLLESVPYFFLKGFIPPLTVVNEILRRGRADAGMSGGCEWAPFEIDPAEYEALVEALLTTPHAGYRRVPPSAEAKLASYGAWLAWVSAELERERARTRGG